MATTSKYFFLTPSADNLNFMDFSLSYGSLSMDGEEIKFFGSSRVDSIYVRPGLVYDLTLTGAGADKIYLAGNLGAYTPTANTTNLTLQRTVDGKNETVVLSGGTAVQFDNLVFADGTVNANTLFNAVKNATPLPTPAGETSAAPSGAAAVGSSLNATIKAFAVDASGETFALSRPGINFTVNGSNGVDKVYVADGATVDAALLGGSADFIYLRGNWADYTKALITSNTKIQFTRTVDGHAESVTVTAGTAVVFDKLVFADGAVTTINAKNAIIANPTGAITAVSGYDAGTTTPGIASAVTTINVSTAPNLSGQSVISGKALANAAVTVTIDPDNNAATGNSFTYTTTANASGDYSLDLATATPSSGSASFVAGTASVSVTQAVPGGASPATVITLPVSTTTSYSASIASDHVTEGSSAVFTVTRSGDTSGTGTVVYATQNGTASAGSDYTAAAGTTLTFAAGQTTKTVTVATTDDADIEGNETLSLVLSSPVGGNLGTASASATIVDNEVGLFSIAGTATGVSFSEGVGTYSFTVSRSGLSTGAATVVLNSGGGTATSGGDYTAVNQTLSFAAGETSKTVAVTIADDALVEGQETFNLQLGGASAGNLIDAANASVTATIQDNEVATISLDNAAAGLSFSEGAGSVTFSLSRSGNTTSAVSVVVQSAGGTATPGTDYTAVNQTISFAAGETSKTVTVAISDDAQLEGNETFSLQLGSPSAGAVVGSGSALATLLDNEQSLWSVAGPGSVSEGAGTAAFTVSRSGASGAATIVFATGGGTATAGSDYTAVNQTLSFAAGEMSKSVNVAVTDDAVAEANETVGMAISDASSGSIATGTASATILDNEQSNWSVAGPGSVGEGAGTAAFTVSRSGAGGAATIVFATGGGTAAAGSDYTAVNQTLSFAAGEMSKIVNVAVIDDANPEANETMGASISNASSGNIATGIVSTSILENDQSLWSLGGGGTVDEGAGFATYVVSRSGATNAAATIVFSTGGGTAVVGSDYTMVNQTLSFAAGEVSKTVSVAVADDAVVEGNETVGAVISDASSGAIVTGTASTTVLDNDQSLWSISGPGNIDEGAGLAPLTVSRTGASGAATIVVHNHGGSSTVGSDYLAFDQTLSFAAGEMSKTVNVTLIDDAEVESTESVGLTISSPSSGSVVVSSAAAGILDNDQSLWSVAVSSVVSEGAGLVSYTVSRTGASGAATILFSSGTGSDTASVGSDYTAVNQTLSFAAGEMSKTVSVLINDDVLAEVTETMGAAIGEASSGTIATSSAATSILDNEQISWTVASSGNVDEGAGLLTYTVSRSGSATAATIEFATAGGTATPGSDFTALAPVTLSFAAGELSKTVNVAVSDDAVAESNETVVAAIGNASSGMVSTGTATATLLDNDQSLWTITAASGAGEGSAASFSVSRTGAGAASTIVFDVSAGSNAVAGVDYPAAVQTLSFGVGEMSKLIRVPINDDSVPENIESLVAFISNASAGSIVSTLATVNMNASDQTRTQFSISSGTSNEDNPVVIVTITRSGDLSSSQTIEYYDLGTGSASAGSDYTSPSPTAVTFAAGETSKHVSVALLGDAVAEGSETVILGLRNASGGAISTATGTITLNDNDTAAGASAYSVSVASNNVFENAGAVAYTINRTGDATGAATTYFRTNGGTAAAGSDYTNITGQTLSWAAGETSKQVLVTLADDVLAESTETLTGQIATDSGFTTDLSSASANILDDDTAPTGVSTYTVSGTASVYESTQIADFAITRVGDLSIASTSYWRVNGGTATAGSDYTAVAGQTLSWAAGEVVKTVSVVLIDDAVAEALETLTVQIATDSGFTTGTASSTRSLTDDDAYTAGAGVADTLTIGTVNGSYLGGAIVHTGDMADAVNITSSTGLHSASVIDLGSGDDTLSTNFFVASMQCIGGTGVDTLALSGTSYNFASFNTPGNLITGFEIVSLLTAGNQTLTISLADVLEFTSGNTVADTLRITGAAGDVLNLQALGKTVSTLPAGTGNLTDVDGTTYNVVASAAGNASANDVTIGGSTYDVYQYQHSGHTVNLLVNTLMTANVI